jgi:hypothetical protein
VEKGLTRQALYVACSRARTLSGLYIEGRFVPPTCHKDDPIELEMLRLAENSVNLKVFENPKHFILHAFDTANDGVTKDANQFYVTSATENSEPIVLLRPQQLIKPEVISCSNDITKCLTEYLILFLVLYRVMPMLRTLMTIH